MDKDIELDDETKDIMTELGISGREMRFLLCPCLWEPKSEWRCLNSGF